MNNYTPMIQQYLDKKNKYKDNILFFRLGDFYEMFFEDAIIASKELEIVLTKRDCGNGEKCPMCGIPFHVAEQYISKLVAKGYKVAICEQLEDPKLAKGLVERDVVQIITPGTIIESDNIESGENNYLMSIFIDGSNIGISYCDILKGAINFTQIRYSNTENLVKIIENEISRINPSEIIINNNNILKGKQIDNLVSSGAFVITTVDLISASESINIIEDRLNIKIYDLEYNSEGIIRQTSNGYTTMSLPTKGGTLALTSDLENI